MHFLRMFFFHQNRINSKTWAQNCLKFYSPQLGISSYSRKIFFHHIWSLSTLLSVHFTFLDGIFKESAGSQMDLFPFILNFTIYTSWYMWSWGIEQSCADRRNDIPFCISSIISSWYKYVTIWYLAAYLIKFIAKLTEDFIFGSKIKEQSSVQ